MTKLNFQWKKKTRQYQTGEWLYLSRLCIGSYEWNSTYSKGETNPPSWVGSVQLPSLTDNTKKMYGISENDIKSKIEKVVTSWFNEALQ